MLFKLLARLKRTLFIATELVRSRCSRGPKYRILFSQSDWAHDLRLSFHLTKHQIKFADLRTSLPDKFDFVVPLNIEDVDFLTLQRDVLPHSRFPFPQRSASSCATTKSP
jgi:hypothetical protein